ncbi:hypothetical protein [Acaryochloris marina]|uniref:Cytotoxic translational repressor of toxin-antitoxin stability system n=1 Tax=Acaryochloris marina (strain MBIC 11017) TaxID=329726 RepID=B0CCS8_ACAM1|nr:hypothetical protein [Acaryochloris marina]ABW29240.1 hypothetical protein AM1_4261 [Acaryochloris marina MBIC11017]
MATRYHLKVHPKVTSEDVHILPEDLKTDFEEIFKPVLQEDPHKCDFLPWHNLTGGLQNYRALEIEWEGDPNAYRLVYRICEKPAPKRVEILSFAEHDPAYEKAKERLRRRRNK